MRVTELCKALDAMAPPELAESWDNVGLLVGDPEATVTCVLTTVDLDRAVLAEAREAGAELVVAYHPPVFPHRKRFVAGDVAFEAARAGVAVYSPHTAFDSAENGTNDVLASALGASATEPLSPKPTPSSEVKLVTFVPEEAVSRVSQALFEAGAGRIGNYSACSFRTAGTGTFFGEEGSAPVVGQAGTLELAAEIRLETVVPTAALARVVAALRASHPYEEPAFDLVSLAGKPARVGLGRVGNLASPLSWDAFLARVKAALGAPGVLVAGHLAPSAEGLVRRIAVGAGACSELFRAAVGRADVYVTGELSHHHTREAVERGLVVVSVLHSNSERVAVSDLGTRLSAATGVAHVASALDRDPYRFA